MEGSVADGYAPVPAGGPPVARCLSAAEAYHWLIRADLNPSRLRISFLEGPRRITPAPEWERAALMAEEAWGLAGVGLESDGDLIAAALVCPAHAIPSHHPLARGGLDPNTAGLALVVLAESRSKALIVALIKALKAKTSGLEAQSSLLWSPTTPSATWLTRMGFCRLPSPRGRYRLDFSRVLTVEPRPQRVSLLDLVPRPAPAAREASR
ncbi:MAG: hypothetical protein LBN10_05550 [Propionibacteriaceae bacterium]|jgi:hypothetical protein|nr:hypothetical protein [Propionibacteriaceae bacterium]